MSRAQIVTLLDWSSTWCGQGHQEAGLRDRAQSPRGSAFLKVSNAFGCLGKGHMTFAFLTRPRHLLFPGVTPPLPSVGWVEAGAVRQPRYGNALLGEALPRELRHRSGDDAIQ